MFVNRKKELQLLEEEYLSHDFKFTVLSTQ